MDDIFHYKDYRIFLVDYLSNRKRLERGVQTKLSLEIGCQPAYVSKVLAKDAHFSLEQAEKVSSFCNLNGDEKDFFILLVQQNRAGTSSLKSYFENQIQVLRAKNKNLKENLKLQKVTKLETQLRYYEHWSIAAIHVLLTIPKFSTRGEIISRLSLSASEVNSAIEFLKAEGMVEENAGELRVGEVGLHLDKESPIIKQHHLNWRMKAMDSIAKKAKDDLHYSSVVSISLGDKERFRDELLKWIANFRNEVIASKEEDLVAIGIDFFSA